MLALDLRSFPALLKPPLTNTAAHIAIGPIHTTQDAHGITDEAYHEPWVKRYWQPLALALACLAFAVLLAAPIFDDQPEKQNCLALLAFVSLLWCTEAMPLFVTSMVVPLLVVVLRVLVDRWVGRRLCGGGDAAWMFSAASGCYPQQPNNPPPTHTQTLPQPTRQDCRAARAPHPRQGGPRHLSRHVWAGD